MTTGPSPEFVARRLQLADEALSDAGYLLEDDRLKAAANRAYYAMFHAVQAALATTNVRMPRTHSATITLFSREFVRTGTLDRAHSRNLQDAFDLRQQSDYEVFAVIGDEAVRDILTKAQGFVAEIRRVIPTPT